MCPQNRSLPHQQVVPIAGAHPLHLARVSLPLSLARASLRCSPVPTWQVPRARRLSPAPERHRQGRSGRFACCSCRRSAWPPLRTEKPCLNLSKVATPSGHLAAYSPSSPPPWRARGRPAVLPLLSATLLQSHITRDPRQGAGRACSPSICPHHGAGRPQPDSGGSQSFADCRVQALFGIGPGRRHVCHGRPLA